MKHRTRKLLAILLTLCLVIPMLATVVSAAGIEYDVWVGGIRVTAANKNDVLGNKDIGATVKYTPATEDDPAVLTLNGAEIYGVENDPFENAGIYIAEDLDIVLIGENTVYGEDSLTEEGEDAAALCGAWSSETVTVKGPGTLNVFGGEAYGYSCGISTYKLVVEGGEINTFGGAAEYSYGVYTDHLNVHGGVLNAYGGEGGETSNGISVDYGFFIDGGEINAYGNVGDYSNGIRTGDDAYIEGGKVTALGGEALYESYGILVWYDLLVSGGTVTALGGYSDGFSYGLYVDESLEVSGGTLIGIGGAAYDTSFGIAAAQYEETDVLLVTGGRVVGASGTLCDLQYACGYGIHTRYDTEIRDGYVAGLSRDVWGDGIVIEEGDVTVSGGRVLASTYYGDAIGTSEGDLCLEDVTMAEESEEDGRWTVTIGFIDPDVIADEYYDVTVNGVEINSENMDDVLGDGTVSYTPSTDTEPAILTLEDAVLVGDVFGTCGAAIEAYEDLEIVFKGENHLVGIYADDAAVVYANSDVKLSGNGSATFFVSPGYLYNEAIYLEYASLTLEDASLLIYGSRADCTSAIYADEFIMKSGSLVTVSIDPIWLYENFDCEAYDFWCGNVTIEGDYLSLALATEFTVCLWGGAEGEGTVDIADGLTVTGASFDAEPNIVREDVNVPVVIETSRDEEVTLVVTVKDQIKTAGKEVSSTLSDVTFDATLLNEGDTVAAVKLVADGHDLYLDEIVIKNADGEDVTGTYKIRAIDGAYHIPGDVGVSNGDGTHTVDCLDEDCDADTVTASCYGGVATCSALAKCDACNARYGKVEDHRWRPGVVTLEPTYDAEGIMTYTCYCSTTKTEAIPKLEAPTTEAPDTTEPVAPDTTEPEDTTEAPDDVTEPENTTAETPDVTEPDTEPVKGEEPANLTWMWVLLSVVLVGAVGVAVVFLLKKNGKI